MKKFFAITLSAVYVFILDFKNESAAKSIENQQSAKISVNKPKPSSAVGRFFYTVSCQLYKDIKNEKDKI